MNIKSKLTLAIGVLVAMIVLLVVLSVVNLQILTATENLTVRQQVPDYSGLYCGYMLLVPHVYVLVLVCGCVFLHRLIILLKN